MNPEEKVLLERTLKLSEESNNILRKIERRARWVFVWGLIKLALIIAPIVIGYLFLEPYFDQILENYSGVRDILNLPR